MKEAFELIRKRMKEMTEFLSDCTKYGNKDAEQQRKSYDTMHMYEIADMVENLIDIVSEVEVEYGNGWIPCSERLPEKYGRYLVCNDGVAWIADFFNSTWFGKRCRYSDVIAWMPLPEPYKPDK